MCDVGFEGLSIEGVAALAGVGKTTIYRRWATKEELILAAIQSIRSEAPLVDTGHLHNDLLALARAAAQAGPRDALNRLLPRLLAEAATQPALFTFYMNTNFAQRMDQFRGMIEQAKARGEVRADADPVIIFSLLGGALMLGWQFFGKMAPMNPNFVEQVVDTVWFGIRAEP